MFGDSEKAANWLKRPSRALGKELPLRLLDTDAGTQQVERELRPDPARFCLLMPKLWRLSRAEYGPDLDGIGGTFADGRWHTRGARVVYFGASAAIVILERLAHTDPDLLPTDLRLAYFELPQAISGTNAYEISTLPEDWIQDENATRRIGGQWWRECSSPLLVCRQPFFQRNPITF